MGIRTMATITEVMLTCDVCGNTTNVQTWTFGLDGKIYEIELCPKDGKDLDKVVARYISKARQGRRHGGRSRITGSAPEKAKTSRSRRRAAKASVAEEG
jgi:hypothetical protein